MSAYEAVVATTSVAFPAGTVPGGIVVSIVGGASQTLTAAPYVAVLDLVPGTYEITAMAIDHNGAALGALVSIEYTATEAAPVTVQIDVPSAITITPAA